MKKLLFVFAAVTALASCSPEDDVLPGDPIVGRVYSVFAGPNMYGTYVSRTIKFLDETTVREFIYEVSGGDTFPLNPLPGTYTNTDAPNEIKVVYKVGFDESTIFYRLWADSLHASYDFYNTGHATYNRVR